MTARSRHRKRRTKGRDWNEESPPESTARETPVNDDVDDLRPSPSDWGLTTEQAREKLLALTCPICGEGPWRAPLIHVFKKHGIDRFTMRDICGLRTLDQLTSEDLRQRYVERGKATNLDALMEGARRRKPPKRWTQAGLDRVAEKNRRLWESMTDEERETRKRQMVAASIASQPKRVATMLAKSPPEHGTTARYRRGCRCDACKTARAAYDRELTQKRKPQT